MSTSSTAPSARMSVLVGDLFACIKIAGRANFNSSIDFKTLLHELRAKGFNYFVLDLSECALMDSTFLGVLAGFGLKMSSASGQEDSKGVELLNANPRIIELLETLGVLQLFRVSSGEASVPSECEVVPAHPGEHSKEDTTRACLEAHRFLMSLNAANAARFKDVAQFLAEDLRKLERQRDGHHS